MFHSRALKCARREFKLYLFTEVYYVTLHASLVSFVCRWRRCRLWRRANPWMNVPKWSKLQRISPSHGVGSNGHCVGTICQSEHSSCTELTSNELMMIWIRCVNKERHAKYAERGYARTGIENRSSKLCTFKLKLFWLSRCLAWYYGSICVAKFNLQCNMQNGNAICKMAIYFCI